MKQTELVLDLYDIATDRETNTRLDAWIQRTVRHKPVFVSVPKLLLSEPEVVRAIFKLEVKVIKLVEARLRYDVKQLTPFESDSANTKQWKMEVIRQHERELNTLTTKANEEAQSGNNWRKVEETSTHSKLRFESDFRASGAGAPRESAALRQLGVIATTGKWQGQ